MTHVAELVRAVTPDVQFEFAEAPSIGMAFIAYPDWYIIPYTALMKHLNANGWQFRQVPSPVTGFTVFELSRIAL